MFLKPRERGIHGENHPVTISRAAEIAAHVEHGDDLDLNGSTEDGRTRLFSGLLW